MVITNARQSFSRMTQTFGYDKLGQLVNDNGTVYAYDAAGNRTGSGIVGGVGNRMTSDGVWAYSYDDAGQLVGKSKGGEAWAYTYDHRGQMTGASKAATVGGSVTDAVGYQTDAWGNRIGRTQTGSTSSTERYVVDGWDTAKSGAVGTENFDAVIDLDGSNNVMSRRVFGAGFDEPVVRRDAGGGVAWYRPRQPPPERRSPPRFSHQSNSLRTRQRSVTARRPAAASCAAKHDWLPPTAGWSRR